MLACPIRSATIFGSTPASSEVVANVGVPHVVQADALDSGPVDELVEPVGDRVGVHRPPVLVADEPPSIVVAVPERLLFGVQHGQVAAQVGDGQRVEGDHWRRHVIPTGSAASLISGLRTSTPCTPSGAHGVLSS